MQVPVFISKAYMILKITKELLRSMKYSESPIVLGIDVNDLLKVISDKY